MVEQVSFTKDHYRTVENLTFVQSTLDFLSYFGFDDPFEEKNAIDIIDVGPDLVKRIKTLKSYVQEGTFKKSTLRLKDLLVLAISFSM